MSKLSNLNIKIFDEKEILKLRAIAKHIGALVDELEEIDNTWVCDCGSTEHTDFLINSTLIRRECEKCGELYVYKSDELPTRFEGSE